MSSKLQWDVCFGQLGGAVWWMLMGWRPCVNGWRGGVFASCLVHCTAPSVAFANQLPILRLYGTPGCGWLTEVVLYQVSILYFYLLLFICTAQLLSTLNMTLKLSLMLPNSLRKNYENLRTVITGIWDKLHTSCAALPTEVAVAQ